jgi:hypothetical protein
VFDVLHPVNRVINLQEVDKEREELLREHATGSKFRPLAVDKGWSHLDCTLIPDVIKDYRASVKECKSHHLKHDHDLDDSRKKQQQQKRDLTLKLVACRADST